MKARDDEPIVLTRALLRSHYLMGVNCDPVKRQDNAVCQCSRVNLGWHPSIGAAVESWIEHVAAVASEGNSDERHTSG